MAKILIIDDDPQVSETLQSLAVRLGHECFAALTLQEGLARIRQTDMDIVFLDVRLPDGNGLDALGWIRGLAAPPDVIVLTGQGDPDGAELAIQGGVWDYLVKPSPIKQIKETLNRALAHRLEKQADIGVDLDLTDVIGDSAAMRQCYERIAQASRSDSTVLVTGEIGTGKELLARTIHRNSQRSALSFVAVDCASLTETLLESILFGHVRGAFTGADKDRSGLIKLAHQGTLFLDEIGELPLSAQKTFLRVLQERRFRPVGSNQELKSDFRLISATNRNLESMVQEGNFRQDLYYRINTIHIVLPPLRARGGDIAVLARHHINKLCRQRNLPGKELDPEFIEVLKSYDWPGNVRELFNAIEQAFVLAGGERKIYAQHLPHALRIRVAKSMLGKGRDDLVPAREDILPAFNLEEGAGWPSLKEYKTRMEKTYLLTLIRACRNDVQKMLAISGLSRSHFYAVLKKHDLDA
ncbi:MAG: sigma-54-dependent Fis family transcriptional regulator [Desulfovibrionales bacterium]|nr:sigma-54-dependent Fis family transcriptional regulator [Desulfovibrionales bacterium]